MIEIIRTQHKKPGKRPDRFLFWLTVAAMILLALSGCSCRDFGYCPNRVFPNSNQF